MAGVVGVSPRGCSRPLQRILCDFGMEHSFARAAARLQEHYGFTVGPSVVARTTLRHAAGMARAEPTLAHALPAQGADWVVAEADGSFLRIVSTDRSKGADRRKCRRVHYREARLCAASAKGSTEVFYAATFGAVETVAAPWAHCAKQAGMGLNSKVHVLADGAPWIDLQAQAAFGPRGHLLIDFYHVCEYLAEASGALSGNPQRWLRTQQKRLLEGRLKPVLKELQAHLEPDGLPDEQAPVRCAYRYLDNRREALAYDRAKARSLPIGSGLIESAHKHVLQARLKIPGAAWSIEHAEVLAQARALRANGRWNHYWQSAA